MPTRLSDAEVRNVLDQLDNILGDIQAPVTVTIGDVTIEHSPAAATATATAMCWHCVDLPDGRRVCQKVPC